jgi:biotin-dependent carboxylase-like uncharacterized protein
MIRVLEPGVFTTVQDLGRPGFTALGVPAGGAADPLLLRAGNFAVGNAPGDAALELTMVGGRFAFDRAARIVLASVGAELWADGTPAPAGEVLDIGAGREVRVGRITGGFRAYLCIAGGVAVPRVFGSASTDPTSGFGGVGGRVLRAGDALELAGPPDAGGSGRIPPAWRAAVADHCGRRVLRAVAGPHADAVPGAADFWSGAFTVTSRSDRAGLRLEGPSIPTTAGGRLASEGMMPGAVQVPQGGQPIILMPDGPTTGGYPVVAVVAAVDLPALGQLPPHARVRFEPVPCEQARALWAARERSLEVHG